mmetsp:Transcript_15098/g.36804  ORF Transcript_15098/g.36804 Transcript_15098/m.36804 type:complete len:223 (+) Transcript_15098:215-883(+)
MRLLCCSTSPRSPPLVDVEAPKSTDPQFDAKPRRPSSASVDRRSSEAGSGLTAPGLSHSETTEAIKARCTTHTSLVVLAVLCVLAGGIYAWHSHREGMSDMASIAVATVTAPAAPHREDARCMQAVGKDQWQWLLHPASAGGQVSRALFIAAGAISGVFVLTRVGSKAFPHVLAGNLPAAVAEAGPLGAPALHPARRQGLRSCARERTSGLHPTIRPSLPRP